MRPMKKRKIAIVTGSRADYGLLYWLLKEIQKDVDLELCLMVTGSHWSREFGSTYKQIEKDGFCIDEKLKILSSNDTPEAVTASLSRAVQGFGQALKRQKPDLMVVLGDRYEMLAAAEAALIAKVPVAHIHGGESTEGLIDEAIRHSITKMSLYHFVTAETHRRRVIRLGEEPGRVFNVGAPGLDHIVKTPLMGRAQLEKELGIRLGEPLFLVTLHPETLARESRTTTKALLAALDFFSGATIVLTKSNADPEGMRINRLFQAFVKKERLHAGLFASLGQRRYLSLLALCDVMIGNSSSGIIEAPAFKKPVVNIGSRQKGRLRSACVIDCVATRNSIAGAIRKAMSASFKKKTLQAKSPFGHGGAISKRIKERLKRVPLKDVLMKTFYEK